MKTILTLMALIPVLSLGQIQPAACTNGTYAVTNTAQNFYDPGGQGGSLCSQGDINNYPNANCETTYRFVAPPGEQVYINFTSLIMYGTYLGWDWMVIHDGGNAGAPILFDNRAGASDNDGLPNEPVMGPDTLCVPDTQMNFCSTGRKLFVRFFASGVVNRAGWEATVITCNALPVELTKFESECGLLKWETATELNNDYFLIEESVDMLSWKTTSMVDGSGTTNEPRSYQLNVTPRGLTYYRLTQVDINGDYEVFKSISIDCQEEDVDIVGYYNLLGQSVSPDEKGVLLILYSDGTTSKEFNE